MFGVHQVPHQIVVKDSSDTYLFVNQGLEVQPAHYWFAQNSMSVLARRGLTTVAAIVTSEATLLDDLDTTKKRFLSSL